MESTPQPQPLEMNNNNSVTFEEKTAPVRLVTKRDGSKEPFDKAALKQYLQGFMNGLNEQYINLDIVVEKVSLGMYNGKSLNKIPLHETLSILFVGPLSKSAIT